MPTLTVYNGNSETTMTVPKGANLRQTLLDANLTPYAWATRQLNCGGRGICATCGVWIDDAPAPEHWHDKLARRFRYPRLSCQITIDQDMVVHLIPEKWVWGRRKGK